MTGEFLRKVKELNPLVYSITNYVTVNDCANALLAVGASPIMSDEIAEAEELCGIAGALNINIGTANSRTLETMLAAGKCANSANIPVVLDPVGAGATSFRTEAVKKLISEIKFSAIKGNISEILTLNKNISARRALCGVDASKRDMALSTKARAEIAKKIAAETGAVVIATGKTDIVANAEYACAVHNGDALMGRITGTGCMLNALIAAFCATCKEDVFGASLAAVCAVGVCGERAAAAVKCGVPFGKPFGSASFRTMFIDELYNLTSDELEECAEYESI